jgi:D-amino-acid dehydrogenase
VARVKVWLGSTVQDSILSKPSKPVNVAVIGCGIVGVCCALELLRDGYSVSLIDPGEPGGEQAASYGNGAWLSPSSVVPMSTPGILRKVPGYLLNRDSPLTIRWSFLPILMPWLIHFVRAGSTVTQVERTAKALSSILNDAPARHQALAEQIGRPELIRQEGLIYPYPSKAAFEAESLAWRLRKLNGIAWQMLERVELAKLCPSLGPRYSFGVFVASGGNCTDPGDYVASIASYCERQGAKRFKAEAISFEFRRQGSTNKLTGIHSSKGLIPCDRAVIAAGIRSKALCESLGEKIALESERGYHVVFEDPGFQLNTPLMPGDAKMAITSTRTGLRVSGQVELASVDAPPDWRRAELLRRFAVDNFPELRTNPKHLQRLDQMNAVPQGLKRWMGHRPSTPDGLPVLSTSAVCKDIFHAFGHGHVGLASGAISGRAIADLVAQRQSGLDLAPFAVQRFA